MIRPFLEIRIKHRMYSKGISLVCSIVTTLGSDYIHSTITVLFRDFLSMLSLGATKNMCPIFPECLFYCFCRVERRRTFVLSRYMRRRIEGPQKRKECALKCRSGCVGDWKAAFMCVVCNVCKSFDISPFVKEWG